MELTKKKFYKLGTRHICHHGVRYVENGRVWCESHCGWSESIPQD